MSMTEMVVTILIWALTAAGCFFGLRAKLRKRTAKTSGAVMDHRKP